MGFNKAVICSMLLVCTLPIKYLASVLEKNEKTQNLPTNLDGNTECPRGDQCLVSSLKDEVPPGRLCGVILCTGFGILHNGERVMKTISSGKGCCINISGAEEACRCWSGE